MNISDYRNPKLLNNLIQCFLNNPDIEEEGKTKVSTGFWGFGSKLFTNVMRIKNTVFADGIWYDETKAHQILLDYINNPECTTTLKPQHKKIMLIYDRLAHLSRGEGTWADGIDKELLLMNEPESKEDEDLHLSQLKEMILDKVFLSDSPEEQVFEKQETSPRELVADPRGQFYTFKRQKGLNPPSHRMLFYIQADEFGSSSELEGESSLTETVHYLHNFLQHSNSNSPSCPESLIDQLGNAVSIQYDPALNAGFSQDDCIIEDTKIIVHRSQEKIGEAFESRKPLLIMGGWTGSPSGHAIYCLLQGWLKTLAFKAKKRLKLSLCDVII